MRTFVCKGKRTTNKRHKKHKDMEAFITSLQEFVVNTFAGMIAAGGILLWIFGGLIGLLLTFFFRIYIAYRMAKNRYRNPLGWVLLSFFFSPLLTWIILFIVGEDTEERERRECYERYLRADGRVYSSHR